MDRPPTPPGDMPEGRPPRPARRIGLWIALAFAAGIVLFAIVLKTQKHGEFFRAGEVPPSTAEPDYAPLPAPEAGQDGAGIGALEPPTPVDVPTTPVAVEPRPAPPPAPIARPAPEPRPSVVADRKPRPIPGQTPSPDYPSSALREGARGTVLVLVHIGPDGVPTATEIAQSSGSRDLDRAATSAVRRWRFEPAIADGHPTVGDVVVPIDFSLAE